MATVALAGMAALAGVEARVWAQDIEVPILVMEAPEAEMAEGDADLDIANIVQTAAKAVTTVQEAPAIVTVVTAEDIEARGMRSFRDTIDLVPGWLPIGAMYNQFNMVATRGTAQATLFLHDGMSLFDPHFNTAAIMRTIPVESIKRLEVVTGPGGVLWGANSYLGVVNIITKDAEDVDGIEASAGFGDGDGDQSVFRGYLMAGLPRLGSDRIKLFAHASVESYVGPRYQMPSFLYHSPQPQPNSLFMYAPTSWSEIPRSLLLMFDGKLSVGNANLYWSFPYSSKMYYGLMFAGGVMHETMPEDATCQPTNDPEDPTTWTPTDDCIDRNRLGRKDNIHTYDRYAMLEWRTRFAGGRAGLTTRVSGVQFVRRWQPVQIFQAIPGMLEGGLGFVFNADNYRAGVSVDSDVEVSDSLRLLVGAEAFREWTPDTVTQSRQGPGIETTFPTPYDLGRLPFMCPWAARWDAGANAIDPSSVHRIPDCPVTFAFAAHRLVAGAFGDVQWRPVERLMLDAGVRVQAAPEAFSSRPYDPQVLGAGAIVYRFLEDWHLKLNFTQGFRPPVFNNTDSNGEAVQLKGTRDLVPERSQAYQAEVNARLFKNRRRLRELDLRADYSYTILDNFIIFDAGNYINSAKRGIHSAEFLGKLYLKGDHSVELGYTWMSLATGDKGAFRSMPQNWFHLSSVLSVVRRRLEVSATVLVLGAFEDPNRRADVGGLKTWEEIGDGHVSTNPADREIIVTQPNEVVLDRIPAAAELQVGARYLAADGRLVLTATAYNALNTRHYRADPFNGWSPRLELLPNPYEDFRFFATASYRY